MEGDPIEFELLNEPASRSVPRSVHTRITKTKETSHALAERDKSRMINHAVSTHRRKLAVTRHDETERPERDVSDPYKTQKDEARPVMDKCDTTRPQTLLGSEQSRKASRVPNPKSKADAAR